MKTLKILTIVGARPQFIKAAAVSRVLRKCPFVREILVHTGQHYDQNMSDVFFKELRIPRPDANLGIGSGLHGEQTGEMLRGIEKIILAQKPDWVLVYGDTNSTLAGSLAAAKLHVPVAHVEAGLRSFNKRMPEEINRIMTDHVSDLLFTPTITADENLRREGIDSKRVLRVGDVMYDAALFYGPLAARRSGILATLNVQPKQFVLVTIHRAENTDDPQRLKTIFSALNAISRVLPVVLPVHPRTRAALKRVGTGVKESSGLKMINPVGYLEMVQLTSSARVVLTDSGGLQKEAYFHGVPCITLREETEWVELVKAGWNSLVPPESVARILNAALRRMKISAPTRKPPLYGRGDAASKIADALLARRRANH